MQNDQVYNAFGVLTTHTR